MGKGSGDQSCREAMTVAMPTSGAPDVDLTAKFEASMLSTAAGDAVGLATELIGSQAALEKKLKIDRVTDFVKKKSGRSGEYSDDTQQTLSIARCINPDGTFDAKQFAEVEIPLWQEYAKGQGYTSTVAAKALENGASWNENFFHQEIKDRRGNPRTIDYRTSDSNGTVMRVAPLALANLDRPEQMNEEVWKSAITTHGHPSAALAAITQAEAVRVLAASGNMQPAELIGHLQDHVARVELPQSVELAAWRERWDAGSPSNLQDELDHSRIRIDDGLEHLASLADNPHHLAHSLERFQATVHPHKTRAIPTLLNSLAIYVGHDGNTEDCVVEASNLYGSDTDTLAAMCGALCGARDSGQSLPASWRGEVQDSGYLHRVAGDLAAVAKGSATERPGAPTMKPQFPDMLPKLRSGLLFTNDSVNHPVLGPGRVVNEWRYTPKKKDDQTAAPKLYFARMEFECGQSCLFKVELEKK